jgi:hypothetical protein
MDETIYKKLNPHLNNLNSSIGKKKTIEIPNNNVEYRMSDDEFNMNLSKESVKYEDPNLLVTEDNFQELIKGEEYTNVIVVDQKSNEYNTIQKALDSAKPYTTIKIKPGIYRESLIVTTPFLDIESDDKLQQAIIISTNKPTIRIEGLNQKDSIRISNLKLANRGILKDEDSDIDFTKL